MREKTNNNDSAEDALRTVLDILTIMTARNHLARINDTVQSSVENNPGKTTTPVDRLHKCFTNLLLSSCSNVLANLHILRIYI